LFENIIGQPVVERLRADIANNVLAPSMLFAGHPASGKSTVALEIGRAFSCKETNAPWNCGCIACSHHRDLSHDDLIAMGPRAFSAEIAAACSAFQRNASSDPTYKLFVRSIRKLLMRFSPVLWADDPKITKLNSLLETINGIMEEIREELKLLAESPDRNSEKFSKLCDAALKHTQKLEAEGIADTIPVSHIRGAAYWLRMAPSGKRKLLIIENADRMQDAARNSLLKILEEPPETCAIILCSSKPEALLPTILSRLRPYGFARREKAAEAEVVRRIFKDTEFTVSTHDKMENGITAYLDKFLPVPKNVIYPVSAFFWISTAAHVKIILRDRGIPDEKMPSALAAIEKHCVPIAEAAGLGKAALNVKNLCTAVLSAVGKFEGRGVFTIFLGLLCRCLSESLFSIKAEKADVKADVVCAVYARTLLKYAGEARTAVDIFNQNPALALENLSGSLAYSLAEL
jgi:DNA polymerase-3 subunit gamma/tau